MATALLLLDQSFFAPNRCRDRGDRPRRVSDPPGRPAEGAGLTKETQEMPEVKASPHIRYTYRDRHLTLNPLYRPFRSLFLWGR
jgi:hypothetical protein